MKKYILPFAALLVLTACGELVAPPQNGPYGAVKTEDGYMKPHTQWTQNWTPTPYDSPADPQRAYPVDGMYQQPVQVYQAAPGAMPYPGPAQVYEIQPPSYPAQPVQRVPVMVPQQPYGQPYATQAYPAPVPTGQMPPQMSPMGGPVPMPVPVPVQPYQAYRP